MILDLDVPFVDSAASQLRFVPAAPQLPVLARLRRSLPEGLGVELRLLGASHQAVVTGPGGEYAETVACSIDAGEAPPARLSRRVGDLELTFSSRVETAGPSRLRQACDELLRRAEADPDRCLVGRFPGAPEAMTSLRVREAPEPAGWVTVHVYPEAGQLVHTSTEISRPAAFDDA